MGSKICDGLAVPPSLPVFPSLTQDFYPWALIFLILVLALSFPLSILRNNPLFERALQRVSRRFTMLMIASFVALCASGLALDATLGMAQASETTLESWWERKLAFASQHGRSTDALFLAHERASSFIGSLRDASQIAELALLASFVVFALCMLRLTRHAERIQRADKDGQEGAAR